MSTSGTTGYVALTAEDVIAVVDLAKQSVATKIPVGRWPRHIALSADGSKLLVGASGSQRAECVDIAQRKTLWTKELDGMNLGQFAVSRDGQHAYFPWLFYASSPTTPGDIRRGWVLGNRVTRIPWESDEGAKSLTLDARGNAVGDAHAVALSPDESRLVITAAGSHELLVLRLAELPWIGIGGSEHLDDELRKDSQRFARIPLGGRPLGVKVAADNRTAYVANYLENSVHVVDLEQRKLARTIPLGGRPASHPEASLLRRGEAIFYDAGRSLENWYSCHSCHYEGGTNSELIDTFNDGSAFTYKTVLPLYRAGKTGPWTWHGWQTDLGKSLAHSVATTMRGAPLKLAEIEALRAWLETVEPPPNPHRLPDGKLTAAAERGRAIFHSERAGCANCHAGQELTDGQIHEVGTGDKRDRYQGFNTPMLLGVYRKTRLLHDGRAKSLEDLLTGPHNPSKVAGQGELSAEERRDLIAYLKSL